MPKLPGVNHLAAVRALEKIGFVVIRQGKHITLSDGLRTVQIPRANPVNAYTMGNIAKQCGLSPDEFRQLL
jgi:predicted RNA binding protein YcfA (HicA-like mRNA interferase family)